MRFSAVLRPRIAVRAWTTKRLTRAGGALTASTKATWLGLGLGLGLGVGLGLGLGLGLADYSNPNPNPNLSTSSSHESHSSTPSRCFTLTSTCSGTLARTAAASCWTRPASFIRHAP